MKKGFEENICAAGCSSCVCAHFCLVFGTVERALCHLNPFSSDWAFVSPVSKGVITDHTDAAGEFTVESSDIAYRSDSKSRAFSSSSGSLLQAGRAACML